MKFGRLLADLFGESATRGGEEDAGDDSRPVLRYKALKKLLKAHEQRERTGNAGAGGSGDDKAAQQHEQQPGEQQQRPGEQKQEAASGGGGAAASIAAQQLSSDEALFVRTLNEVCVVRRLHGLHQGWVYGRVERLTRCGAGWVPWRAASTAGRAPRFFPQSAQCPLAAPASHITENPPPSALPPPPNTHPCTPSPAPSLTIKPP